MHLVIGAVWNCIAHVFYINCEAIIRALFIRYCWLTYIFCCTILLSTLKPIFQTCASNTDKVNFSRVSFLIEINSLSHFSPFRSIPVFASQFLCTSKKKHISAYNSHSHTTVFIISQAFNFSDCIGEKCTFKRIPSAISAFLQIKMKIHCKLYWREKSLILCGWLHNNLCSQQFHPSGLCALHAFCFVQEQ